MSTPADVIRLPTPPSRLAALNRFRVGDIPVIPIGILATIALVAGLNGPAERANDPTTG